MKQLFKSTTELSLEQTARVECLQVDDLEGEYFTVEVIVSPAMFGRKQFFSDKFTAIETAKAQHALALERREAWLT